MANKKKISPTVARSLYNRMAADRDDMHRDNARLRERIAELRKLIPDFSRPLRLEIDPIEDVCLEFIACAQKLSAAGFNVFAKVERRKVEP